MATPANDQRPIIIKRVKKVAAGHHGGAWKVAYADFVTAMMAFFMLLWLVSNPDKEMLKGLARYFTVTPLHAQSGPASAGQAVSQASTREPAGTPAAEAATAGSARGGSARIPDAPQRVMAQELRIALSASPEGRAAEGQIRFEQVPEGLRIDLMDNARRSMFRPATAQLNPFGQALLARIARETAGSRLRLSVEGHTDDQGGSSSEANWQLSAARAQAARRALLASGVTSDRIAGVIALAGTQPVYADAPGRPENRRITIIIEATGSALPAASEFGL